MVDLMFACLRGQSNNGGFDVCMFARTEQQWWI